MAPLRADAEAAVWPRREGRRTEHEHGLVFTGAKGVPMRRSSFNPRVDWMKAVEAIGAPRLHFHDLRHTGNTLAAATGVSTRDLMARMGHDSMNAAIIHQHATREADRVIADALDVRVQALREAMNTERAGLFARPSPRAERPNPLGLCQGLGMARQSVTQHLGMLEEANLVAVVRSGRQRLHYLNPVPLREIQGNAGSASSARRVWTRSAPSRNEQRKPR